MNKLKPIKLRAEESGVKTGREERDFHEQKLRALLQTWFNLPLHTYTHSNEAQRVAFNMNTDAGLDHCLHCEAIRQKD